MKNQSFTMQETGHASIMTRPSQKVDEEYVQLKEELISIKERKKFSFESDYVDNRRTIECIKANKFTKYILKELIRIEKETEELLLKFANNKNN